MASSDPIGSRFPLAVSWGAAAALSTLLMLPYLFAIQPELRELPVSVPVFAAAQFVQVLVVTTVMAWVGLKAGASLQLGAPLTQRWVWARRGVPLPVESDLARRALAPRAWRSSVLVGLIGGALVAMGSLLFDPCMPPMPPGAVVAPGPLLGFLASFYGGIAEELQLRLFVVSGLAWLFSRVVSGRNAAVFAAVVVAAFLFGLGHLPAAFGIWDPTTVVVVRTIVLNMALGLPFGFIFADRGLEHAVVAHFCSDLVLHVVTPVLTGS